MADKIFLDTNVLVYADTGDPVFGHAAQTKILDLASQGYELWINRQVIREYCVIVSRKMKDAGYYDPMRLVNRVRQMEQQFLVADETTESTDALLGLITKYSVMGKFIHDCNIVATIKTLGISNLIRKKLANPQAPKTIYVPSQFIEIQSRLIEMLVTDVAFHREEAQICTTLLPNRQQPSST
jgi:predicted nucleic acid-binding protein